MTRPLLIDGMHGLGDNLYQRAVLAALERPVHLVTSWPQFYADLPHVRCVKPGPVRLRTQTRNSNETPARLWSPAPVGAERIRWHYVHRDGVSILEALCAGLGVDPARVQMSGPPVPPSPILGPYIVVRPATVRREWRADSRNPDPVYIARAAEAARAWGWKVVSLADLHVSEEWALDPVPPADVVRHRGEGGAMGALSILAGAEAVVGGVGWIVPAALAYRRRLLLIYGGWGGHNGPGRIFGRHVDTSRVWQATPDNFCLCTSNSHDCDKRITDFEGVLSEFLRGLDGR